MERKRDEEAKKKRRKVKEWRAHNKYIQRIFIISNAARDRAGKVFS
jgi:hypothetical protein